MDQSNLISIGLRAKTGRAIAVVLGGPLETPVVLLKTEIKLVDPKVPGTAQPYHEVMDLRWEESQREVRKYAAAIERTAQKALAKLIEEQRTKGLKIAGVGIVGAPDRDLARIGNPHIRAHAGEGVLFRRVLDLAAQSNGLKWQVFSDRNFDETIAAKLGVKHLPVKQSLSDLGRAIPPPWRADEKQAAMAAWFVLSGL
ncbi:MAG TPA: hypothetical protein VF397_02790 [Pyrinomonadaceae bacterium]